MCGFVVVTVVCASNRNYVYNLWCQQPRSARNVGFVQHIQNKRMDSSKLIAHPSVRVRGSEHSFEPVECSKERCVAKPFPHLHCPFCTTNIVFKDPRIVKAHYRVKHVDKGLYFAGLKMLRCSATCKISGSIKGEKKFRGPHWHCYKCKNGFCRRDEALKHFETHFKLPQTTFQINIVQDVYEGMGLHSRLDSASGGQSESQTTSVSDVNMDSNAAVAVTVDMTEEQSSGNAGSPSLAEASTTVMIIEEEDTTSLSSEPGSVAKTRDDDIIERNALLEKLVVEFRQQMENMKAKHADSENLLQLEITNLRRQLERKNAEIEQLKKQQTRAFSGTTSQADNPLQKLLTTMQSQHSELLWQHITQVRAEAFQSALNELQTGTTILAAAMEGSGTSLLQPENNQVVTMVLSSPSSLGTPLTLGASNSSSVVCPVKTVLHKFGTTSMPVIMSSQPAYVQPQPRAVQQGVGGQHLVLALAETGEVSQDMVSNAQQGSTVVACTDLQYQLPSVTPDEKDEEEAIEECTS